MRKLNVCNRTLYSGCRVRGILSYYVTEDELPDSGMCNYGVGIKFYNLDENEEAVLPNITNNYRRIRLMIRALSRGYVTPVTLTDVVSDIMKSL